MPTFEEHVAASIIVPAIIVRIGSHVMPARLETGRSPRTVLSFVKRLPWSGKLIHARWSGEALWMPLGDAQLYEGFEHATTFPAPGQVLWHPQGPSEAELLIPYGPTRFASRAGEIAGNHFMTLETDLAALAEIGRSVLWNGAVDVTFDKKE